MAHTFRNDVKVFGPDEGRLQATRWALSHFADWVVIELDDPGLVEDREFCRWDFYTRGWPPIWNSVPDGSKPPMAGPAANIAEYSTDHPELTFICEIAELNNAILATYKIKSGEVAEFRLDRDIYGERVE